MVRTLYIDANDIVTDWAFSRFLHAICLMSKTSIGLVLTSVCNFTSIFFLFLEEGDGIRFLGKQQDVNGHLGDENVTLHPYFMFFLYQKIPYKSLTWRN